MFTQNAQETTKLGKQFANKLKGGGVLCLYGDLGSGKTTFLQGLAKGLGICERILSPTFILVRQYPLPKALGLHSFYHIDLYRVEGAMDAEGLGLKDFWGDDKNIVAIEWSEKIEELLPKKRINIHFEYVSEDERKITILNSL